MEQRDSVITRINNRKVLKVDGIYIKLLNIYRAVFQHSFVMVELMLNQLQVLVFFVHF